VSAVADRRPAEQRVPALSARDARATALLAGAGSFLLLARALLRAPSPPLLLLVYGGLAAGSLAVSTRPSAESRRLGPVSAAAAGIALMWLAGIMSGTPPPSPAGSLAAGLALNAGAAVAEDAFFRRFLYDRAQRRGAVFAVGATAVLFALVHVPIYGGSVFWVDLGAGLLFGWQRWASGSWGAPAATHAAANVLVMLR